uniref:Granulins domain-containing protein n=1 Tax=Meloidogyne floridensis TaxID=298350 RepID=A0A915NXW9_9BILA
MNKNGNAKKTNGKVKKIWKVSGNEKAVKSVNMPKNMFENQKCNSNDDCCTKLGLYCRFSGPGTSICRKSKCIEKNYYYCDNKDNKCCPGFNCKTDYIGRSFCRPYNCGIMGGACNIDNNQCCYGFHCLDKKCVKTNFAVEEKFRKFRETTFSELAKHETEDECPKTKSENFGPGRRNAASSILHRITEALFRIELP